MADHRINTYLLLCLAILQIGSALDCPVGWDGFGSSCYKFVARSLGVHGINWENARARCLGYAGDLVSVASKSEMDFIYNTSSKVINEHYWIGLKYQRNASSFVWSDGTPYNKTVYSNWLNGEPKHGSKVQICTELFLTSWIEVSCKNEYGYICERPKGLAMPTAKPMPPSATFTPIVCPPDWVFYGSSCYKFVSVPEKWIDAKKNCRASGGYLLKIDSKDEQHFITLQLRLSANNMWIGLSDAALERTFIWEGDDSAINYTHWGPGAPDNFGGAEDCVEVFSGAMAGFWNDDYCDSEKFYICERPNGQSICPVNWRTFGDSCYQFNVHTAHHATWESAETACTTFQGAELVSVLDAKEQNYILKELKGMKITQVWLGLNDRSKEGTFQWSDRSVVKYVHWASHEPSKGVLAGEQDCVLMDATSRNGSWSPNSCTLKTGYICKRQIGLDQCDSPLGMEDGDIADGQITASSSLNVSTRARHARLRHKARHNTLGAWCAASNNVGEYLQIDLGVVRHVTHIALQGRPESLDYVRTFFFKFGDNHVDWNIYMENGTEKHKVFQGNSDGNSVHSVILPEAVDLRFLRIYPLKWHNNICLRAEVYGCASQASSKRCGIGWEEGLNYTCYQFNTNEQRLWADARASCIRRGGDLVSIESPEEKQWLLRRLKPLHRWAYSFWLGLNDRDMKDRYYWSDGTPFKMTSWDSGHPNDPYNLKSCAEIRSYFGTWWSISCGEHRPYICKRKLVFEDGKKIPITGNWISGTDYYWPLDRMIDGKALGTVLATVVGNVTIPNEKQNGRNVFHFQASHAYLDAGQFTGQCITDTEDCHNGITVSFVARFEDGAKTWTRKTFIVDTIGDEMLQNDRGFAVYVINSQLCVSVLTERKSWSVKETLIVGLWHHVMFTWQREQGLTLYIDGKRKSSSTFGTTLFPPHTAENPLFVIGSRSYQPTAGGFYIRSLALWKRYLSEQAVDEVYLAEFGSCQPGWKAFGQFCYQLNRKMKQWHTARVSCINEQADLVSIHSPVEQAFLNLEIASFVPDSAFWIGLNDKNGEQGEFEWSDNSDVEYSFWGSGEPDDWGGDKDCSLLFHSLESGWNDENCRYSQPYICKKRKEYITSGGNPSITVSHKIRVCDPGAGFVSHRTIQCPFSFVISVISATWGYTTANVCGYKGNTKCQLNVTSTLRWKCEGLTHCIVRISREDFQPDPCVGVFKYLEVNYKCIEVTNSPGCPVGWKSTPDGSRCFGLQFDRKNWKDARDACKAYGADLASFHNKTENTVLTSLLVNSWDIADVEGIWIGLSDSNQRGMYRWSDGSRMDYSSWMIGEPDDIQFTRRCVRATIQRGKVHWLFWKDNDCSDVLPYACSKDSKYRQRPSPLPSPFPTTGPLGVCPSGWKLSGSSCYKFFRSKETWITARYRCKHHHGSDLVSIHSMDENKFVAQFLKGSLFTAWLGLTNRGVFKGYVWSDDSAVHFTNWKPEQPDSHQGQQPCVEMYSTGNWGDTGCYSAKPFICKRPRPSTSPVTNSVAPPRTIPKPQALDICPPNWLLWNTMCYFYGEVTKRNWHDARRACLQAAKGADLVSIHSYEENEFLRTEFSRYVNIEAWIGLNDLGTKASYKWSDGSPLIYTNYDWGQPDDNQGQEDCTFMSRYGRWVDRHCSAVLKYICKTHNNSVTLSPTSITATPKPVLRGCPDGWINYDKSCYLLVTDSLQSWHNARNACWTVLDGNIHDAIRSDLVTINDQYEQAFLTSILRRKRLNVWIGINQLLKSGYFLWTNNDAPKYTNWDLRQPTSSWGYNCGQMTSHPGAGRWKNVPCDYKNGFICETGVLPIGHTNSSTTAAPETRTCPDRYELLGDNCYFVSHVKVTWQEAREACGRESDGDLISIDSPFEQDLTKEKRIIKITMTRIPTRRHFRIRTKSPTYERKSSSELAFVVRNMKNLQGGFWLGFHREPNSSDFFWTDNSLPMLTNWASNQPSIPKTQRACVVSENSGLNAGLWNDVKCSARNGFICKIRKGEPYVTPQLVGNCPKGWVKFDKGCYRFETNSLLNWAGARVSCQERGGNLVSITSKQEQDFLSFHVREQGEIMIWIGLNDRAQERGYEWSDNSALTFLNWGPGQPSNTGDKNCVLMGADGLWKDWSCGKNIGFICKHHLGCYEALGMTSGSIPDAQITASSSLHASYGPGMARLNSLSSWCVNASERGQNIQIDLLAESRIAAIATQGFLFHGAQSFVQTFQLQTSDDAVTWKTYQKFGQNWVFVANRDGSNVVTLSLKPTVDTRFVRLLPLSWHNMICLRIELYGCKFACQGPLGMQSGRIKSEFLSASSFSDVSHSADQARPTAAAWCPENSDVHPWLQIDFPGPERKITKISTWGGVQGSGYVSIYRLAYKKKSTNWTDYTEGGKVRNFRGNQDTIHPETHILAEPFTAQFVRLKPLSWSKLVACLRLELFGCQHGCDSALGLEHGLIKDSALSSSSFLDQAHGVTEVRLNGRWAWCASDSDTKPYFMVDLGKLMKIRQIGMQGAADGKGYVKTYTVSFKRDPEKPWKAVWQNGKSKLFVANAGSAATVTNTFPSTLHARFVKVLPTTWNTHACFRLELYGCEPVLQATEFPSESPGTSKAVVYRGSVRLSKEKWTDDYGDPKSQAFKKLTAELRSAIINVYSGTDEPSLAFIEVAVTGFRRGSVVAMFELSFYRDMAEDPGVNVTSKLVLAVRNGKLGELEVDPGSLTISIYVLRPTILAEETVPPGASSSGLSDGAKAGVAIGALLLCGAVATFLIWLYRKKRKWEGAIYKPCDHSVSFTATTEEANLL